METSPEESSSSGPHDWALDCQKRLRKAAREINAAATVLGPLTRPKTFESIDKAAEALGRVEKKMDPEMAKRILTDRGLV